MRTRYKTNADYGMLKSDEEKTRERCLKASAKERLIILQCAISAAPGLEIAIYDSITGGAGYRRAGENLNADTKGKQGMERLTHERVNEIKSGYWSAAKKDELIARLAEYENTGKTPEEINEFENIARKMAERVAELSKQLSVQKKQNEWISVEEAVPGDCGESVLVTVSGRHGNKAFENALQLACYFGSEGWLVEGYPYWEDPKVKAWMHLPKEYGSTESGSVSEMERVEETMHSDWKERAMQTFLGSRRR